MPVLKLLFGVGDDVRIDEGPLQGFTGTIQELDESQRKVLLDVIMFRSPHRISLDANQVSKV